MLERTIEHGYYVGVCDMQGSDKIVKKKKKKMPGGV